MLARARALTPSAHTYAPFRLLLPTGLGVSTASCSTYDRRWLLSYPCSRTIPGYSYPNADYGDVFCHCIQVDAAQNCACGLDCCAWLNVHLKDGGTAKMLTALGASQRKIVDCVTYKFAARPYLKTHRNSHTSA